MRVTRLEVFGFKSFMDRLILPLEQGITGVVGPNGCGKSNIVDAIRWILGETRASSLRGDVLEDIIFNGTEKLRPLGLAEVSLTLRSSEKDFFADLLAPTLEGDSTTQELLSQLEESTKQLEEASFEEEEFVNDKQHEINQEQFAGSEQECDRPRLTVIQGSLSKSDSQVLDNGVDSSAAISDIDPLDTTNKEEATKEAQTKKRKNANALSFLAKFSWLRSANEVQVTRRVYRSGESEFFMNRVPCRLKDIKDLFRALGLSARAYTVVAQGEVSRIVTSRPEERRLIVEEAAGVVGFRDKIAAARRRLEETDINLSRIDDVIGEVSRQVSQLKKQAQRARDRQALKDEIARLEKLLYLDASSTNNEKRLELKRKREEADQKESGAEAELYRIQSEEGEVRASLLRVDVEGDEVRSRIDAIREEINNRARQRSAGESRLSELRAFQTASEGEKTHLSERIEVLNERREMTQAEISRLTSQEEIISDSIAELERRSLDAEIQRVASELEAHRQVLKERDAVIRQVRDEFSRSQGILQQIEEQILASSPVTQLKETLALNDGEFLSSFGEKVEVLANYIRVEPRFSRALQAVLKEKAEYLVSPDPFSIAKAFAQHTKELASSNRSQLGLGVFGECNQSQEGISNAIKDELSKTSFSELRTCIECDGASASIIQTLTAGVYVAPDLDSAIVWFEKVNSLDIQANCITIVTLAGEVVTQNSFSSFNLDGGMIQLKTKLDEMRLLCASLQDRNDLLNEERSVTLSSIEGCEVRQAELLRENQKLQSELRALTQEQASVRGRLQSEQRVTSQIQEDLESTSRGISLLVERLGSLRSEEMRIIDELSSLVSVDESSMKEELQSLRDEHARLDKIRREGYEKLSGVAELLDTKRKALDSARADVSHLLLEEQKLILEEATLRDKFLTEFGEEILLEIESVTSLNDRLNENDKQEHRAEVLRLRAKILREGEVDASSIERYEEENDRLTNLTTQRHDLKGAADTLQRTIDLLTETSKERFVKTFQAVRKNFAVLMPRLFGGGKADLELTDPANPLECGIDVIVRPPGKKLRSIDLLSGGEKALCAIALIFAMFLERPSPLCVLDEVDAPLDEANLVRLLAVIKEMCMKTQFIMITHNKKSMTVSDSLIGVTMQEPGASKVISVSLQEAYSQVA